MIDLFGLRFIREQLVNILLALSRMERTMSDLDAQVNERLDGVDRAIAEEKVQSFALANEVRQLRAEIKTLKEQLAETPILTQATIARIESLASTILGIVEPA